MIALISPAKSMCAGCGSLPVEGQLTQPRFMEQSHYIVSLMTQYSSAELEQIFKVSPSIARELKQRFAQLQYGGESHAAIDSYDGVVYRHFKGDLSLDDRAYLQRYVRISSLLYGLLRPLDSIMPYRMEGFVRLAGSDARIDSYWRDYQTQTLIEDIEQSGGVLLYLASKEEQKAFHWREVERRVKVIDFQFLVNKGDKLRQIVIYTKMARGELIRYMCQRGVTDQEELKLFEWGGYRYCEALSSERKWVWVME